MNDFRSRLTANHSWTANRLLLNKKLGFMMLGWLWLLLEFCLEAVEIWICHARKALDLLKSQCCLLDKLLLAWHRAFVPGWVLLHGHVSGGGLGSIEGGGRWASVILHVLLLIHVLILARDILGEMVVGLWHHVASRRHVLCFDNRETRLRFMVCGTLSLHWWISVVELHFILFVGLVCLR